MYGRLDSTDKEIVSQLAHQQEGYNNITQFAVKQTAFDHWFYQSVVTVILNLDTINFALQLAMPYCYGNTPTCTQPGCVKLPMYKKLIFINHNLVAISSIYAYSKIILLFHCYWQFHYLCHLICHIYKNHQC